MASELDSKLQQKNPTIVWDFMVLQAGAEYL